MRCNSSTLEWTVPDDDDAWRDQLQGTTAPRHLHRPAPWTHYRISLAIAALLTATCAGLLLWRSAQNGLQEIHDEIQVAVEVESWLAPDGPDAMGRNQMIQLGGAGSLAKTAASGNTPSWFGQLQGESEVQIRALKQDRAAVKIFVHSSDEEQYYRQTRFYHYASGEWQRAAPDPELWGDVQTKSTAYFHFTFRRQDGAAVGAAAAELDYLYSAIRRDLGLAAPTERLFIAVDVAATDPQQEFTIHDSRLTVPSPSLAWLAENDDEGEFLIQLLVTPLVNAAVDEAQTQTPARAEWLPMVNELRRWQLRRYSPARSAWHEDASAWLYTTARLDGSELAVDAASTWEEICYRHGFGGSLVMQQIGPPVDPLCSIKPSEPQFMALFLPFDAGHMRRLWIPSGTWWYEPWGWAQSQALATQLDYATSEYGVTSVPALLQALHDQHSWDGVTLQAFGVPEEEFEAGWQVYLWNRFGERSLY